MRHPQKSIFALIIFFAFFMLHYSLFKLCFSIVNYRHNKITQTHSYLIKGEPFGSIVSIDGKTMGTTPLKVNVGYENKIIEISKKGYRPQQYKIASILNFELNFILESIFSKDINLPRFLKNSSGTIIDYKTKLEWLVRSNVSASMPETIRWIKQLKKM